MENKYDVDYFIKKFESIPEENWNTHKYSNNNGQFCALGHCKVSDCGILGKEAISLVELFNGSLDKNIVDVNDNQDEDYKQSTPKQRILAALNDIKKIKND